MGRRLDDRPPRDFVPPRVGTPRDPDSFTYGPQVTELAEKRLGIQFMPHQSYAADVALEVDSATGLLKYDEVVLSLMRQVGKTVWVRSKMIWRVTRGPKIFGQSQVGMYTAQKRQVARKRLERDFIGGLRSDHAVNSSSFVEITNPKGQPGRSTRQWKPSMNNGQEHIQFGRGNYLQIDAPNRDSAHSDTLDEASLDEAWALQNDDVEQAVDPTMLTRENSQKNILSAAGDHKSFYWWPKVRDGRKMVADGRETSVCYLEWSVPLDADLDDEEAWWEYIPALQRTVPVYKIRNQLEKARNSTEEDAFDLMRRGVFNQWPRIPILATDDREDVVTDDVWKATDVGADTPIIGDIAIGFSVAPNGVATAIAVAGRNAYGRAQLEVAYFEPGTFWFPNRLAGMIERNRVVAIAYTNDAPSRAMAPDVRRAAKDAGPDGNDIPVIPLAGSEWAASCTAYVQAFNEGRANHVGQRQLRDSILGARKKWSGLAWKWDWLTSTDSLCPTISTNAAHRAIEMHIPEPEKGGTNLW